MHIPVEKEYPIEVMQLFKINRTCSNGDGRYNPNTDKIIDILWQYFS